jgi:cell division protease FtsH
MLGGYAAEELVFHDITTGPHSDLRQATDLARRIITEFGMSAELGPVTFPEHEELVFLGRDLASGRHYSEETAKMIDAEVKKFINAAYEKAKHILETRRATLDRIAKKLIEVETLERDAFEALVKEEPAPPLPHEPSKQPRPSSPRRGR